MWLPPPRLFRLFLQLPALYLYLDIFHLPVLEQELPQLLSWVRKQEAASPTHPRIYSLTTQTRTAHRQHTHTNTRVICCAHSQATLACVLEHLQDFRAAVFVLGPSHHPGSLKATGQLQAYMYGSTKRRVLSYIVLSSNRCRPHTWLAPVCWDLLGGPWLLDLEPQACSWLAPVEPSVECGEPWPCAGGLHGNREWADPSEPKPLPWEATDPSEPKPLPWESTDPSEPKPLPSESPDPAQPKPLPWESFHPGGASVTAFGATGSEVGGGVAALLGVSIGLPPFSEFGVAAQGGWASVEYA